MSDHLRRTDRKAYNAIKWRDKKCQNLTKDIKTAVHKLRELTEGRKSGVAAIVLSILNENEISQVRATLFQDKFGQKHADQAQLTEAVASIASGSDETAVGAKQLLAHAGAKVLKDRSKVERATNLKYSWKLWTNSLRKLGKRPGRKNLNNDPSVFRKVREYLHANSTATAHYIKVKKEMVQCRALTRSKRKLWQLSSEMQQLVSIALWHKHLRTHHRHFRKFKKKVDICPVCHKYDKLVLPKVRAGVKTARDKLLQQDASYFDILDKFWQDKVDQSRADPDGEASLQYIQGIVAHIDRTLSQKQPKHTLKKGELAMKHKTREVQVECLNNLKTLRSTLEVCEHHFHGVRRQHQHREFQEDNLPKDQVLLQMDYAENLTLPVGPQEEQTWFWATSRLGISTLGIYALYWHEDRLHKAYFHYLSQILDHTALHASEALKDVLERIPNLQQRTAIQIWTDCGPHYRAYAFVATGDFLLHKYPALRNIYFHYFCEHHGKGRNDGQFGLQRHWIDSHTKMFTISSLHELLAALKQQATLTMRTDPPPGGPRYEIIHFHPQKPKEFKYLDAARCDLKIEYTYCLNFARSDRGKYPILMNDFIYSDRASDPSCARRLGPPTLLTKTSEDKDWRVSYRQNQPEKDVLPEDLLRRRLAAQKEAKGNTTSRRLPVLEQLRQQERRYAKQKLKDARERVVFGSADSSSSSSGSSTDTNED